MVQKLKVGDFGLSHLRRHPIWTWADGEEEDELRPVEMTPDDLETCWDLMIHSMFRLADGTALEGKVVYDIPRREIRTVGIYLNDEYFGMNRYAWDLSTKSIERLANRLNKDPSAILPFNVNLVPDLAINVAELTFGPPTNLR